MEQRLKNLAKLDALGRKTTAPSSTDRVAFMIGFQQVYVYDGFMMVLGLFRGRAGLLRSW